MLGLEGKTAFVFGVASEDSIAWAICKQLAAAGVTLYLGCEKRFMSRVFKLKDELPAIGFLPARCRFGRHHAGIFHGLCCRPSRKKGRHSHSCHWLRPRSCFDRPILFVEDDDINTAMTISANSLQRCLKHALPYLNPGSSTITLTYAASNRFVPSYGIMSMAKAALGAGHENWLATLAPKVCPTSGDFLGPANGPSLPVAFQVLTAS